MRHKKHNRQTAIKIPPGWRLIASSQKLSRIIVMSGFDECIRFVGDIGLVSKKMNHHPDIYVTHVKKLRIVLSTHSAKKVTALDTRLALLINQLLIKKKFV